MRGRRAAADLSGPHKLIAGALFCLIAGVTWGAQSPIAGSALKLIDPFYFTLLRYMAVSLVLMVLLIVSEGTKALGFEGRATAPS